MFCQVSCGEKSWITNLSHYFSKFIDIFDTPLVVYLKFGVWAWIIANWVGPEWNKAATE